MTSCTWARPRADGRVRWRRAGARGKDARERATARARAMTTDACAFVVAVAIGAWLEVMRPTQRFVPRELMWRYSYPHGENTVPTVMVPVVAFLAPLCFALWRRGGGIRR